MTAILLDGKKLAETVRGEVREGVDAFRAKHGRVPGPRRDPGRATTPPAPCTSATRRRPRRRSACGARCTCCPPRPPRPSSWPWSTRLNDDAAIDGILVQLPLPKGIDERRVLDLVDHRKDVDGFHPVNAGLLALGRPGALVACTPSGCMRLLALAGARLEGAHAVVVGRSNIVGKPMAQLLLAANATVTIAHSRTRDLPAVCRQADVLVAAVGKKEMIRGDWIKPGAVVIDVGMNRATLPDGKTKLHGDVAFDEAVQVAARHHPRAGRRRADDDCHAPGEHPRSGEAAGVAAAPPLVGQRRRWPEARSACRSPDRARRGRRRG